MKYLLKGDCHGNFIWLDKIEYKPEDTAIIFLGDVGLNFYLTKSDYKIKKSVNNKGFKLYCLRGNHEARPTQIRDIEYRFDEEIDSYIYIEPEFPNIRYLVDGYVYKFGQYQCLCIGGAYSVDKWYRLARGMCTEETNNPKKTGWFPNEQLTYDEMSSIQQDIFRIKVDFVFTHTCPLSFMPTDLFLSFVDQSTVDNTMEYWMEKIKDTFDWNIWCFGHFHADRIERPHVEQYFNDIEELDTIYSRWNRYDKTGELDWWLQKGPNFYMK